MVKLQKFLFDTDFDAPRINAAEMSYVEDEIDVAEIPPVEPPPPTFSEEELALAREQAFVAGRQAGLQEAERAAQQMIGMALAGCAHHLQALAAAQAAANEALTRDAVAIALAVIRKLHPEFCRLYGVAEIAAAVEGSLAHLDRAARITMKVHPDLVESVRERCDALAAQISFEGKLIVTGDPQLPPGDCRLEWGDGGAERDGNRTWTEIDKAVETALGTLAIPVARS